MNTSEAFHACGYICPICQTNNTVRTSNNPYLRKGFNCKECKTTWTLGLLYETYGFNTKLVTDQCAEYFCDHCGHQNIALGKYVEEKLFDEGNEMLVDVFHEPKTGICQNCNIEQKLVYPIDEEAQRCIDAITDDSKIPHPIVWVELTPEEKQLWMNHNPEEEEIWMEEEEQEEEDDENNK